MLTINGKKLVDLGSRLMQLDILVSDSKDLQNVWMADVILASLEKFVIGKNNNPRAYAKMCREILEKSKFPEETAIFLKLGILNGERRLPLNLARKKLVFGIMGDLDSAISSLPEGRKKARCKSFLEYQRGVVLLESGDFSHAAVAHARAAEEASDLPGKAISLFMEELCQLKHGLSIDKPSKELNIIFSKMEERLVQLTEVMRGSNQEIQWANGNGPAHMLEACVLLNRSHPSSYLWVDMIITAAKNIGPSWDSIAEFVSAVDMDHRNDPQADQALRAVLEFGGDNEKAIAILLLVRRAIQAGKVEDARDLVKKMPQKGTQHIRAIAEREIALKQ